MSAIVYPPPSKRPVVRAGKKLEETLDAIERIAGGELLRDVASSLGRHQYHLSLRIRNALQLVDFEVGIAPLRADGERRPTMILRKHGRAVIRAVTEFRLMRKGQPRPRNLPKREANIRNAGRMQLAVAGLDAILVGTDLRSVALEKGLTERVVRNAMLAFFRTTLPSRLVLVQEPEAIESFVESHGAEVEAAIHAWAILSEPPHPAATDGPRIKAVFRILRAMQRDASRPEGKILLRMALAYLAWFEGLTAMELADLNLYDVLDKQLAEDTATLPTADAKRWGSALARGATRAYVMHRVLARGFDITASPREVLEDGPLFDLDEVKKGLESRRQRATRIGNVLNAMAKDAEFPDGFLATRQLDEERGRSALKREAYTKLSQALQDTHATSFEAIAWRDARLRERGPRDTPMTEDLAVSLDALSELQRIVLVAVWHSMSELTSTEALNLFTNVVGRTVVASEVLRALSFLLKAGVIQRVGQSSYCVTWTVRPMLRKPQQRALRMPTAAEGSPKKSPASSAQAQ